MAISQKDIKKYNETFLFLKNIIDIFYNVHLGSEKRKWFPFQSDLILSTITGMEISEYLIWKKVLNTFCWVDLLNIASKSFFSNSTEPIQTQRSTIQNEFKISDGISVFGEYH